MCTASAFFLNKIKTLAIAFVFFLPTVLFAVEGSSEDFQSLKETVLTNFSWSHGFFMKQWESASKIFEKKGYSAELEEMKRYAEKNLWPRELVGTLYYMLLQKDTRVPEDAIYEVVAFLCAEAFGSFEDALVTSKDFDVVPHVDDALNSKSPVSIDLVQASVERYTPLIEFLRHLFKKIDLENRPSYSELENKDRLIFETLSPYLHLHVLASLLKEKGFNKEQITTALEWLSDIKSRQTVKIKIETSVLLKQYSGIKGYVKYADDFNHGSMYAAYQQVSAALSDEEFDRLGWKKIFSVTAEEFQSVMSRLFDAQGNMKYEMTGSSGYALYADAYAKGKMKRAYEQVADVLSDEEFARLEWGKIFLGTAGDFKLVKSRIFNVNGEIRKEIIGPAGYFLYALLYANRQMKKAYEEVADVLSDKEFVRLEWSKIFLGTTKKFRSIRARFFDKYGELKRSMKGFIGHWLYADSYTDSQMQAAYAQASAVLSNKELKELGWEERFTRTTDKYKAVRSRLFDDLGNVARKMTGAGGYLLYADSYTDGQMHVAYMQVFAALTYEEFKQLRWGKIFPGTIEEYNAVRPRLFDDRGNVVKSMTGPEGYLLYVGSYTDGQMHKAYVQASVALTNAEFEKLEWGKDFWGTDKECREMRSRLFDEQGNILEKMTKPQGYLLYADSYTKGHMYRAYMQATAALTDKEFKKLEWGKVFPGTIKEYKSIRPRLFDEKGNVIKKMTKPEGYLLYADSYAGRQMHTAYVQVSAALTDEEFKELRWGKAFPGTIEEYKAVRPRLFDEKGNVIEKMTKPEGYLLYADSYADGQMHRAYMQASVALTNAEFEKLEWGKDFRGTDEECRATRSRLFDEKGNVIEKMTKPEGYLLYADSYTDGQMHRAYVQASAALTDEEFKKLKWGKSFPGKVKEYKAVRPRLFDEKGNVIEKMTKPEGYLLYADSYTDGQMHRAYVQASAALTDEEFKKLEWGRVFPGTIEEYKSVRPRLFDENGGIKTGMSGPRGYASYADLYVGGQMQRAHTQVSAVLKREEFVALKWGYFKKTTKQYRERHGLSQQSPDDCAVLLVN